MAKFIFPEPALPKGYEVGNNLARPESPTLGDIYSNTETGYIEVYTAAGWSQLGVIPLSATIGTATDVGTGRAYDNGAASVTFTPNAGGGLVSSYTVTSTSGGYSASGSSSPIVVSSIPVGTSATFTVTATNGYGNALASSASNSATITTVPQTPNIGTPTNVTGAAFGSTVSASVPVTANATGGKAVSGFTVTSTPGSLVGSGTSPVTVAGLTSGTSYTFRAVATNANGNSEVTSSSSSLTPSTVPQAPTIGTVTRTNATTVSIPFTAGATGGSSITSYTATSTPSIALTVSAGTSTPLTVTGSFASGIEYTITIAAVNANGASAQSSASNTIIPNPLPTVTGGTLTSDATYYYRTFTASGDFTVTNSPLNYDVFVAGGGGGGGGTQGGGGGGGYTTLSTGRSTSPATIPVVVGAGGAAVINYNTGGAGGASSAGVVTAAGGNGGGTGSNGAGGNGGSGGGRGGLSSPGGAGGTNGGNGSGYSPGIGQGTTTFNDWNGSIYYGGGGGGGANSYEINRNPGGATGGGASGRYYYVSYGSNYGLGGSAGTGGGGGGAGYERSPEPNIYSGPGGSGKVIFRYLKTGALA
jgi:hypothetical protein